MLQGENMTEQTQTIGTQFAERRKELKLSLKEVESATSIRTMYLEAIEAGQMDKLISPVYAQGFVRQYAAFLGLDGDRVITENPEIFRRSIVQEFSYGIGTLETRNHPGAGVKGVPHVLWIAAFGVLAVIAYLFAKALDVI
jgi:transcriptional regulator with XRE-family HTH domain